ncbi:hypothetical protein CK203_024913 [Vitis vinifera]|uniref:Uncharacterized protein n=1 Tax=Vitis vinifera TaxID=29760 RepID=A0A438J790_VITVI|nr:hypothetical protein CK203_024913 [Vitis vinifera]
MNVKTISCSISQQACPHFDFISIAVYKALYKSFGGFAADVVAAIDQVCGSQCDPFYKDSLIPQTRCTFEKVENLLFSG